MSEPSALTSMMKKVLRPLARLLLRNGVAYADFSAVARRIFVEVASEDFGLPGRKQSVSRVSILTGVNRKEVKRLLEEKPKALNWGEPLAEGSFEELVKRYSGDMTARAILDQ